MPKNSKDRLHPAEQYVEDVLSGKIPTYKFTRLAVERYVEDLETGKERGLYFDYEAAQHAIDFFQFLKHSKGEWAGTQFRLEPWQQFITWCVFGWKNESGFRRFRTVYTEVARKNGKSTYLSGVGLYLLVADNEPGAEIYSAAVTRDQAVITHSEATRMVRASSELKDEAGIAIFKNNLHIVNTASKFEPLSKDYNSMDGLNIHGAVVDELHAHKTRDTWDVLDTATGSRRQPLIWAITTAGFDRQSICWEQHEYTEKILTKTVTDDTFFGIIYALEDEQQWEDEKLWVMANPNLGVSVKYDDLKRKAKKAKETPAALNSFLRKHMDVWTTAETRWMDPDKWDKCKFPVDEAELAGKTCYGGLDLSSNTDITAFVLVFPPEEEEGLYQVLGRYFIPEEKIVERSRRDRVPYESWKRQKLIFATPGNVIDYNWILYQIDKDSQEYDLREIAFDRWGATKIMQDLQEMGFEEETNKHAARHLIQFGQGYKSMSPPMKHLETLVLKEQIAHGGNIVLSWAASNVMVTEDPAGNIKPDKNKSTEKIDPVVALIMALDRALKGFTPPSKYEGQGLTVV